MKYVYVISTLYSHESSLNTNIIIKNTSNHCKSHESSPDTNIIPEITMINDYACYFRVWLQRSIKKIHRERKY